MAGNPMEDSKGASLLSVEAALTLIFGLVVGLIPDMEWSLRALGVLGTAALAIHTARRLANVSLIALPLGAVLILIIGTWHSIWRGFQGDFPSVTGEDALSKIIEFSAVAVSGIAGYFLLLRPRTKEGYRVLPVQVIAFGICLIGVGFLTALFGLGWQFQQNWANGTKPSGAPTFTLVPPQITQVRPLPALPPPQGQAPQTPFFADYNLTEAGVNALADELYKVRDALGRKVELDRMNTDGSAGGFISNFVRACDRAAVDCPIPSVHPNSPDEKGLMIYVSDVNKPPEAAQVFRTVLLKLGINVPFVARPGFGTDTFSLFVGPRP
jgi:hypothetical protein